MRDQFSSRSYEWLAFFRVSIILTECFQAFFNDATHFIDLSALITRGGSKADLIPVRGLASNPFLFNKANSRQHLHADAQ